MTAIESSYNRTNETITLSQVPSVKPEESKLSPLLQGIFISLGLIALGIGMGASSVILFPLVPIGGTVVAALGIVTVGIGIASLVKVIARRVISGDKGRTVKDYTIKIEVGADGLRSTATRTQNDRILKAALQALAGFAILGAGLLLFYFLERKFIHSEIASITMLGTILVSIVLGGLLSVKGVAQAAQVA